MRLVWVPVCLLAIAGCNRPPSPILGTWHVDPLSIKSARLAPGGETKSDWIDATKAIGNVEVSFLKDGTVTARGLGQTSTAHWKLKDGVLQIEDAKDAWPAMTFDPAGPRIHLDQQRQDNWVKMDLIKSGQ